MGLWVFSANSTDKVAIRVQGCVRLGAMWIDRESGMVDHTDNPTTGEAEVGESITVRRAVWPRE